MPNDNGLISKRPTPDGVGVQVTWTVPKPPAAGQSLHLPKVVQNDKMTADVWWHHGDTTGRDRYDGDTIEVSASGTEPLPASPRLSCQNPQLANLSMGPSRDAKDFHVRYTRHGVPPIDDEAKLLFEFSGMR